MAAGDEDVGAEILGRGVLVAEPVDAVDGEQDPLLLVAAVVRLGDHVGDVAHRQLHARPGVDPRDREAARLRGEPVAHGRDDLVDRRLGRVVVELQPPHLGAVALGAQAQRLVRGVEVVLGRHDLLPLLEAKARVDEAEAHRGRVGERDLLRARLQVVGGRLARGFLDAGLRLAEIDGRVPVELGAVLFDRVAHGLGMRGEDEGRQVDHLRVELEEAAHAVPAFGRLRRGGRGHRGLLVLAERTATCGQRGQRRSRRDQGSPAIELDVVHRRLGGCVVIVVFVRRRVLGQALLGGRRVLVLPRRSTGPAESVELRSEIESKAAHALTRTPSSGKGQTRCMWVGFGASSYLSP